MDIALEKPICSRGRNYLWRKPHIVRGSSSEEISLGKFVIGSSSGEKGLHLVAREQDRSEKITESHLSQHLVRMSMMYSLRRFDVGNPCH